MFLPNIPRATVQQAGRYMGDLQDLFEQTLEGEEATAAILAVFLSHTREHHGKSTTFRLLIESQVAMCIAEDHDFFNDFGMTYPEGDLL